MTIAQRAGALWLLTVVFSVADRAAAQEAPFGGAVVVSGSLTAATNPAIVMGGGNRLAVCFESLQEIFCAQSQNDFTVFENVSASSSSSLRPQIVRGAFSLLQIAYEEVPFGGTDSEIYVVGNLSGAFAGAAPITDNLDDDRFPVLQISAIGELLVAWQSTPAGGGSAEVQLSVNMGRAQQVALGARPQLAGRSDGSALVAYLRGGQLFMREYAPGGILGSEQVLSATPGTYFAVALGSDATDRVHAVVVKDTGFYYTTALPGGAFGALELLGPALVSSVPRLAVNADGDVALVYSQAGNIFHKYKAGATAWGSTQTLVSSGLAINPSLTVDDTGFVYIAFAQNGQIHYLHNAPAPTAAFSAGPALSGILPFDVGFDNLSSGVITTIEWDFGDGETSGQFAPTHTYTLPGTFNVMLTVSGPGGTSTVTEEDLVATTLPGDMLSMPRISVFAGEAIQHPVHARHLDPLQGFQIALRFDGDTAQYQAVNLAGSAILQLTPEFVFVEPLLSGAASELIIAIIFDAILPFDGRVLAPSLSQVLLTIDYEVSAVAPFGGEFDWTFTDGLGSPPISNIFSTSAGISVHPYLLDGRVTVDQLPQTDFVRGDANHDLAINIGDAVFLLSYLFASGGSPLCPDAADSNDDGIIDLADAIKILSFLFAQGPALAYPYPGFGLDPTSDALGACAL